MQLQMRVAVIVAMLLVAACKLKDGESVQLPLLSKLIVEKVPDYILFAAIQQNKDRVDELDWRGATPLMYAAGIHINDPEREADPAASDARDANAARVVKALLDSGASPNIVSKVTKVNALLLAVNHGRRATVELLLHRGADANIEIDGQTALKVSAYRCYGDIADLLLTYGAQPAYVNGANESARSVAERVGCEQIKSRLSANTPAYSAAKNPLDNMPYFLTSLTVMLSPIGANTK